MFQRSSHRWFLAGYILLAAPLHSGWANPPRDKTVWNYDGGVLLETDGAISQNTCFHLYGRVTADKFFDNLRRIDSSSGTFYRRGNDIVTQFPDIMHLSLVLYDRPCSDSMQEAGTRIYLTKEIISTLRLRFSWKRGMEMRPAREIVFRKAQAHLIPPYAEELAKELPERFEWWFDFDVPGKGIPLTDSLVLVIYTPEGRIAARVAARM